MVVHDTDCYWVKYQLRICLENYFEIYFQDVGDNCNSLLLFELQGGFMTKIPLSQPEIAEQQIQ